jgi:hypothetical protein
MLMCVLAVLAAPGEAQVSRAQGVAINVPLAARLVGAGNTLFITSVDVTNHSTNATQVDFYFDGVNNRTGAAVVLTGSVTASGLVAQGAGVMRGRSNVHLEDFFASLIAAGMLPAGSLSDGFVGSALFVFNGFTRSGEGAVTARFKNAFGGGTVGVALRGREMTAAEPQQLVAAVRDTRGNGRGEDEIYPNLFINHTGVTPAGVGTSVPVIVELSAVSNTTGVATGTTTRITINSGQTAVLGSALQVLGIPAGSDDTILVYARVVSGNAAIHGIVSQIDNITRDGSVFEMSRAD